MEIILKEDVNHLGNAGEIVSVKSGYGSNYLIPKGLATLATASAKKVHAEVVKQRTNKDERLKTQAVELAEQIKNKKFKIGAKTSTTGKIFGSVNNIQIAEALAAKGFDIDRKKITLLDEANIKEVGTHKAIIKLYKDVKIEIAFEVVSE